MGQRRGEAVDAGNCAVTDMAELGQSLSDVGGGRPVILDQQKFQDRISFTRRCTYSGRSTGTRKTLTIIVNTVNGTPTRTKSPKE